MSTNRPPFPTKLRSPRGASVTEIDWSDSAVTRYAHQTLRALCPCAQCQGHDRGIRWLESIERASKLTLEISELEQVGNYAIGFTWADGHTGGIYTFEYLRELGPLFNAPVERLRGYRRG